MISLDALYYQVVDALPEAEADLRTLTGDALGAAGDELGRLYRTAAIGAILLELDVEQYAGRLLQSAQARVYVLKNTAPDVRTRSRFCTRTRADGFFDAVSIARVDLAAELDALSPTSWNPRFEYEDDFAYVRCVQALARPGLDGDAQAIAAAQVARMEEVLQGASWSRLDLCRALIDRDTDAFDAAFEGLLRDRVETLEAQRRGVGRDELTFTAGQYVFIEGLALLHLAEELGIQTRDEYRFCPREVRRFPRSRTN